MIDPIEHPSVRGKLSAKYLEMIRELDTIHFMLRDQAIELRDAFFADAKREGKILYRTVQVKVNKQESVSIIWKRVSFVDLPGGKKKQRTTAIPKGKGHSYRQDAVVKNADYWLQQLFHTYEPKFAIIRESLVSNMKARKTLLELQRRVNANPPIE